jgi:hypothetical protein
LAAAENTDEPNDERLRNDERLQNKVKPIGHAESLFRKISIEIALLVANIDDDIPDPQ